MDTEKTIIPDENERFTVTECAEQLRELEEVCRPVAEYLRKNYPHMTAVIKADGAKIIEPVIGVPLFDFDDFHISP